jgi:hypothetical protein
VHAGLNTPKDKEIYLQANWQGGMPLPKLVKPANPTQNEILQAQNAETECHKAHITAQFWVKSGRWYAIPSPVLKQTAWTQSGVWDSKTWTCSMPNLHTTVSSVEEVRVAAYATYGFLDGKEKPSKVSVYMQTL